MWPVRPQRALSCCPVNSPPPPPRAKDAMSDSVTDSVADGASPCNDPRRRHDLAVMDGDAVLNVSVMTLRGAVLVIVSMSCRSPIWAAKVLIEKSVSGKHMKAVWVMLMHGPQIHRQSGRALPRKAIIPPVSLALASRCDLDFALVPRGRGADV